MKKINSVNALRLPEKALGLEKLSQETMEYEMDDCPAPWKCPEACYESCAACLEKMQGGK